MRVPLPLTEAAVLYSTLCQVPILGCSAVESWIVTKELRLRRMARGVRSRNGLVVAVNIETSIDVFKCTFGEKYMYYFRCAERNELVVLVENKAKILMSDGLKDGWISSSNSIEIRLPKMVLESIDVCSPCLGPPALKSFVFEITLGFLLHVKPIGSRDSQRFGRHDVCCFHQILDTTTQLSIVLQ
jgi:hypothetical protein